MTNRETYKTEGEDNAPKKNYKTGLENESLKDYVPSLVPSNAVKHTLYGIKVLRNGQWVRPERRKRLNTKLD